MNEFIDLYSRCSIMFVMKPDTFDAYFEVCTDEKEQFIPPLVYDTCNEIYE
ncbi:hypothetical protein PY997_00920 [Mycoplasmopsis bovis]|uniref:hypothetical protein n=1 Tax=Mycoplasmopsis bovis TaxID=28903 RepID=UPI0023D84DF8|nr:hypothetical protein [Mycoplasmopsis bovis]WEI90508.1 hypothetical protein PY997_00920 [Mycoplasmopsis bovis]